MFIYYTDNCKEQPTEFNLIFQKTVINVLNTNTHQQTTTTANVSCRQTQAKLHSFGKPEPFGSRSVIKR